MAGNRTIEGILAERDRRWPGGNPGRGHPYGKALGYYKNRKREEWASLTLTDDEVVGLVNVKFLSAHYGLAPDEVIKLRKEGDGFVKLSAQVKIEADRFLVVL
jgi:hypothetical protein